MGDEDFNSSSWQDDLAGAWEGAVAESATDNQALADAPLPAAAAGGTTPLAVFDKLAGYGLNAVKTFNDIKLANSTQQANAALARQQLATQASVATAQQNSARYQAMADQSIAQLRAGAQVAQQRVAAALSDPKTLALVAIVGAIGWKLLVRPR